MTLLTDKHWAGDIPVDATDIVIHNDPPKMVFSSKIQDPAQCGGDMICLPPGSYRFLFTTGTATEEDARRVVKQLNNGVYHDYSYSHFDPCDEYAPCYLEAVESLRSLLRSKGLDDKNNYAIIEKM